MQKKEKEKRLAPPTAYRQKAGRVSQVYGYLVCREKKGKKEKKEIVCVFVRYKDSFVELRVL